MSTLFVAYLVFPLETLNSNDVSVRIDGPAGWNGGAPIVRDYPCGAGETCWVEWFVFGNCAGVEVVAMNADSRVHPVKVEPFAQAYEYVQFTVGE